MVPWHFREDYWHAASNKAIGFAADATHLGNNLDECRGISWIMSTSDPEEAETAIEMVRGAVHDEDDHSLVLIFDGRYGQLGPWGEDAKLIRIPGTCSGRLQLKKVWIVEVGSSPAKLKTRAETPLRVTNPVVLQTSGLPVLSCGFLQIGTMQTPGTSSLEDQRSASALGPWATELNQCLSWTPGIFNKKAPPHYGSRSAS